MSFVNRRFSRLFCNVASQQRLPLKVVGVAASAAAGAAGFSGLSSRCDSRQQQDLVPPLVIFGPSGAGKGTLIAKLQEVHPNKFGFSVSHTTRQPRPGEVDGKDYHFTTLDDMKKRVAEGQFVEHAQVHANMYGTSKAAVESVQKKGQICILDIDVQGVQQVKSKAPFSDVHFLFIAPPSIGALEKRLRGRGTEKEEQILKRLKNATGELEYGQLPGSADMILVNDQLDIALDELLQTARLWYPSLR